MTREDLAELLEKFATCAISASMVPEWTADQKLEVIMRSIDTVVETVMICSDKSRVANPSIN